jgi:hypothetical protein
MEGVEFMASGQVDGGVSSSWQVIELMAGG